MLKVTDNPSIDIPSFVQRIITKGECVLLVNIALKLSEDYTNTTRFDYLQFAFYTFHSNDLVFPSTLHANLFQESFRGLVR